MIKEQLWGEFKDNKRHGTGKIDCANGDKYLGGWIDDNRTGQGVDIYASGNYYELSSSQMTNHSFLDR